MVNLLLIQTDRVIINPQGEIVDQVLHSPFAFLFSLASILKSPGEDGRGSELVRLGALAIKLITQLGGLFDL
jgi:hypothetical protein